MKISSWNLNGYKSRHFGSKLLHEDFLTEIGNSDVLGLTETHIHKEILAELHIPGFVRIAYKNEIKTGKKGHGGIAVFIKEHLVNKVTPIQTEREYSIWVKVKKELFRGQDDLFLACVYMNPHKSNADDTKKFQVLQDEVMKFQAKGRIILTGDLNARIGKTPDYILPDRHNFLDEDEEADNPLFPERNSEDPKTDNRGVELLELCKSLNLVILNGRKPGDMFGKVTSIQSKGCSVVDYVVSDFETFSDISSLNVSKYSPWLSDHCALHFDIFNSEGVDLTENSLTKEKVPKQYRWGDDSRENFLKSLVDNERELKNVEEMDSRETEELLLRFTKTVSEIAEKANLKVKKQKKSTKKGFIWFDDECAKAKKDLKILNKELQLDPHSATSRQKCFFANKKYKNLLRTKKRQHRNQIICDMSISKNDSKKFWKLLDKLKAEDHNEIFIERMGARKVKTAFESILRAKNDPVCPPDSMEKGPLDTEITLEELKNGSYVLRPGKSTGPDPISYEMLECIIEKQPNVLLKLFNSILLYNGNTPGWYKSILILLYKKGSKTEPLNYRGISLLSCVSKLFTAILNKRLLA